MNNKKLFLIHETQNKFDQRKLYPRGKFRSSLQYAHNKMNV